MNRYSKLESKKFMRTMQLRKDRIARKEMKTFESDTEKSSVRLPKRWRNVFYVICPAYMAIGIYFTIQLLLYGIYTNIELYIITIVFFTMAPLLMLMYPQAHTADERTMQIEMGDLPPMPADDHSPGKYTFTNTYKYNDPDDTETPVKTDSRVIECGRIGDLDGMWSRTPWAIIWLALAQFGSKENGGTAKYAGYTGGNNSYKIPVKVQAMRFRTFERVYRNIAQQLKQVQGIGGDITPSTWILYGWETVSIPEGISQGYHSIPELELWEGNMRNAELMDRLHDQGLQDKMYKHFDGRK